MDYTNTTDPPPRQLFQASTSPYSMPLSEFASIVAHFDNKSGQHIVLWRAILQVFNNAIYIDNGGEVVSFLVDEDFNEILPERILYHPGVTLKVIVAPQPKDYTSTPPPAFRADTDLGPTLDPIYGWSSSNVASSQINPGFPRIVIAETQDKPSPLARGDFSSGVDIRHQVPSPAHILFAAQVSSTEANLVGSCFLKQEKQPYHQSFSKKDLCLQDLAAGQMQVANLIDNHFKKVLVKLDKTETLSEQSQELQQHMNNELHQTRRELHQTRKELRIAQNKLEQIKSEQQDMHKELMEKQQQLNESQQQAMDRLALIQNRVHAVITQTYELHEYSIPRLFIILPKERRKRDKFSKPFSKMFRLYFLCECGAHTKTEGSKISHQIHLAKHDGYDIEKPDEFIEKYGSYVLTILQMVKYGFIAAGVALPALGHIKIIEGIDAIRRKLDIPKATIGSLIDESISFISEQTANTADRINLALDGMELDKQEVLEGANLRQLKSYLKVNDASRVLGNMYRIVTMEGHVKWVCMDHYNDIHELSAIKGLREIVQAMGGNFVVEEGSITVKTDSSIQAEQFYAALVKARCAQLLNIELNWEVTQEDLQALATAATKARVINFRLSGCLSRDLVGVPINRTLFQPVLELMSNGVIQTVAFSDIYNRDLRYGDAPSMRDAPGLRELTITDVRFFELQSFAKVLEHCQSLTRLRMRSDVVHEVFDLIRRDKSLLPQLSILELEQSEEYCYLDLSTFHLIIHFSEGRIESVEVAQFAISYFVNEMTRKFLLGGHLSKMSILFYGDETDEERYMDIIRHNPMLTKLDCHALGKHVEIIDWTVAARRDVLASRLPAPMLTFEGVSTNYECEQDDEYHMCYSLEFEANSSTFDISSDIAPQKSIQEDLLRFCRIYGWSITEWCSDNPFNNAATQAIEESIRENGYSRLEELILNLGALSLVDFECMLRIYEESPSHSSLIAIISLSDNNWQQSMDLLRGQTGKILTKLILWGSEHARWTPEVAKALPSRRDLPKLESLEVGFMKLDSNAYSFFSWLTAMLSDPSLQTTPQKTPSSRSQSLQLDESLGSNNATESWTHLERIKIRTSSDHSLEKHWRTVFATIDLTALTSIEIFQEFPFPIFPMVTKIPHRTLATTIFLHFVDSILLLTDADASLPLKWMKIIDIIEHPQDVSTRFVQLKQRAPEAQLFVEL